MSSVSGRNKLQEIFKFVLILFLILSVVSIWFAWQVYNIISNKILSNLEKDALLIERIFSDTVDHTSYVMKTMVMQIRPKYTDKNYIDQVINKYRTDLKIDNELSWTIFSWADSNYQITVDSVYGIMKQTYDLSGRDYIPYTKSLPNIIHLGKPVYGSTSKKWMIPAGLGVYDKDGKNYIGAMTIGFNIENLQDRIEQIIHSDDIIFKIFDKDKNLVINSDSNSTNNLAMVRSNNQKILNLINFTNLDKEVQDFGKINLFDSEDSYYVHKMKKYPYVICLQPRARVLHNEIISVVRFRAGDFLLAVISIVIIFLIYKHETKLRKDAEDSQKLEEIARKEAQYARDNLEAIVQERTQDLKKALSIKTEFLNNVSHEVRTPVQAVTAYTEALLDNWQVYSEKERYDMTVYIKNSADRLFSFVSNILDISKIEAGKISFNLQEADIVEIARNIIKECEILADDKQLKLRLTTSSANIKCLVDEEKIGQVIRNLITNAIKFSNQGVIEININVTNTNEILKETPGNVVGQNIEVKVIDNGVGIPDSDLEEIFVPFSQSSRTKTKAGGTGLGLTICKKIITEFGGKIWAEPGLKNGAMIVFTIPLFNNTNLGK